MTQYARPTSLVAVGGWSGSVTAIADSSGVDDATVMTSAFSPTSADILRVALSATTNPTSLAPTLRVRFRKQAAGGEELALWLQVRNGLDSSLVANRALGYPGATVSEWSDTLTPAETAAVTSWSALECWLWATVVPAVVSGAFTVVIIYDTAGDYQAVAHSTDGTFLSAGTFTLPVIGVYDCVITNLEGPYRSVTVSAGSVSHATESGLFTVDAAGVVAVTIETTAVNAVVTVD